MALILSACQLLEMHENSNGMSNATMFRLSELYSTNYLSLQYQQNNIFIHLFTLTRKWIETFISISTGMSECRTSAKERNEALNECVFAFAAFQCRSCQVVWLGYMLVAGVCVFSFHFDRFLRLVSIAFDASEPCATGCTQLYWIASQYGFNS